MSTSTAARPTLCPAPEMLGKLLREELDPTEAGPVEEHVGACPGCQRVLGRLVGSLPDALTPHGRGADEEPPDLPGYTPLGRIDAGGMGVVWRVRDLQFGRYLAVKVMASWGRTSPKLIERFIVEARICAQLTHPFIVPVHTMSRLADGRPYYTMKLVEGRTLAALLEGGPALADRRMEFVQVFDKVCQAAAFAHGRGVIHRDLKPENVMVGAHGEVQLMDWGLAKLLVQPDPEPDEATEPPRCGEGTRTRAGSVLGTAAYMAPEQAQGHVEDVDRQSDVFGLGGMLCRILTGEPPYTGPNAEAIRRRAAEADLEETRTRLRDCGADPELIQLAERCLAPRKADRLADAGVVTARLAAYQAGVQERLRQAELERAAAQATAAAERAARWRTRALAAAVLALVTLAAGGGLWAQRMAAQRRAEQARQEGALRQEVADALDRAVRFREAGDFDFSRQLLEQTEKRLADGGADDLRTQLEQCLADTALARSLDHARQGATDFREGQWNFAAAERDYAAAFAEAGLGREGENPAEVAARVRASAVRAEIVATLDDWSGITRDNARRAWLLAVARAADPDPARDRLRQPELWRDRKALMRLVQKSATAPLPTQLAHALGRSLLGRGGDAVPLLRMARAQHPDDFGINIALGQALWAAKQWDEAIGYFRAAQALRPRSAVVHNDLGNALSGKGQVEEAISHYEQALRLDSTYAHAHYNLGNALKDRGQAESAIGHYEEAIRLDPTYAMAHNNLGFLLSAQGRGEAALRHYEEAFRLDPKNAQNHNNLGLALYSRGQVEAAIGHYEEALRLDPKNPKTHNNLGNALRDGGQVEAAIGHYEEALRLDPKYAMAHYNFGNTQFARNQVEAAIGRYEEALRLDPKYAMAHCNLGHALIRQGRFEEALTHLQQGHQLGSKKPGWRYSSDQWVRRAQRLLLLDRKLPAILKGQARPADAEEQLGLAEVCTIEKRNAAAARFYADAFAVRPSLIDVHRYNAACAAVLAGCGQDRDAARLSDTEKARLRRQAREWLDADLALRTKQLTRDRRVAEGALRHWLKDADLAGVRDPAALAQLSEEERRQWRSLWQQLERLLGKTSK